MHIVQPSLTRDPDEDGYEDGETKMWNNVIFPKRYPDSREDISILKSWLMKHLGSEAELRNSIKSDEVHQTVNIARKQLHVLDLAQSELVRQLSLTCVERGQLLSEIWALNRSVQETIINEQQQVMIALHRRVLDAVTHSKQVTFKSDFYVIELCFCCVVGGTNVVNEKKSH
jgi:hypothetical protein